MNNKFSKIDTCVNDVLSLSDDGIVRIDFNAFKKIPLQHLCTELSNDDIVEKYEGDCSTELAGFTEWCSDTSPCISISWDWRYSYLTHSPCYIICGDTYSNLIFLDQNNKDMSVEQTDKLLKEFLSSFPWQITVKQALDERYI